MLLVNTVTITANIVSALFLTIILMGSYRVTKDISKKIKYYRICVWINLAGLLLDAFAYLLDGKTSASFLLIPVTFLAYIIVDVLIAFYAIYLHTLIQEKEENFSKRFTVLIIAICVADATFMTIGTATGNLFSVESRTIVEGPWSRCIIIAPITCMVCILALLIVKAGKVGIRNTVVLSIYLVMPLISAILQIWRPDLEVGYVGSALALMTIYVMIQSKIIAEANVKAEAYNELSVKDVLTGLKNRRGYEDIIASVPADMDVGVVFSDINSLKVVNDSLGHESGDKLIRKSADLLSDIFTDSDVCRISGDEFVVIRQNLDPEQFQERIRALESRLDGNGRILSYGTQTGKGGDLLELIKYAERNMYDNKRSYYEESGRDRRR